MHRSTLMPPRRAPSITSRSSTMRDLWLVSLRTVHRRSRTRLARTTTRGAQPYLPSSASKAVDRRRTRDGRAPAARTSTERGFLQVPRELLRLPEVGLTEHHP